MIYLRALPTDVASENGARGWSPRSISMPRGILTLTLCPFDLATARHPTDAARHTLQRSAPDSGSWSPTSVCLGACENLV